jgi:hypothetical protein
VTEAAKRYGLFSDAAAKRGILLVAFLRCPFELPADVLQRRLLVLDLAAAFGLLLVPLGFLGRVCFCLRM